MYNSTKLLSLLILFFIILSTNTVYGQSITIGEDGIVRCKDVPIGTTQIVNGNEYEVVDRNLLIQRRDEGADLTKSCVSNVTNMKALFTQISNFNQPIISWDVSNVTDMSFMFRDTNFNQPIGNWDVSSVTDMQAMFWGSFFNQNIGGWNVKKVLNMKYMFFNSEFNQPIGNWDVSNVTDMSLMFNISQFNQPIGNWNVSSVKDMSKMFRTSSFNQPLDQWDVSNVTNMSYMFRESKFNNPIGMWNVGLVTNMEYMFYNSFYNHPLENWNVSSVVDMSYMFRGSRFNQPIGSWNVSNVLNMIQMFYYSQFNQSITFWCVENILTEPRDFAANSPLASVNKPNWGTCTVPETPTQFYPDNNSINVSRVLQFSWSKDMLSNIYQLQVTKGDGTTVIDTLVNDTTFTNLNAFQENVEFSWRVRGFNQSFKRFGGWSDVSNFTTGLFQNIILLLPRNHSTAVGLSPTLQWNREPNSESYTVQVSKDEFESTVVNEIISDTSFNTVPLSYSTEYKWRVRGVTNADESNWSEVWNFTTIIEKPSNFTLTSPENNAVDISTTPTLTWNPSERAEQYQLLLAVDSEFTNVTLDSTLTDTSFIVPNSLSNESAYYWRVKALNVGGVSDWSEVWSFTTVVATPMAIDLLEPANNASQISKTPTFLWATSKNTYTYQLQLSENEVFNYLVMDSTVSARDTTLNFDDELTEGATYYWRVRGENTGGVSEWTEVFNFEVEVTVSNELEAKPTEFTLAQNYPNPFNPTTQINFGIPEASQVELSVFNMLGQKVATLVNERRAAGWHSATFNASGLSSGFYIYRIQAGSFVSTKKLMLIK